MDGGEFEEDMLLAGMALQICSSPDLDVSESVSESVPSYMEAFHFI